MPNALPVDLPWYSYGWERLPNPMQSPNQKRMAHPAAIRSVLSGIIFHSIYYASGLPPVTPMHSPVM